MAERTRDEIELRVRMKEREYMDDLRDILSRSSGIRFFKRFFKNAKIFDKTFTGNSNTYYREGQREMALEYFEDVKKASIDKFLSIWKDILEDESNDS